MLPELFLTPLPRKEFAMCRLNAMASWLFTCLGITLLGVSILVVPADVFADAGDNCYAGCSTMYPSGGPSYNSCVASCCGSNCGSDSTCYNNCVAGDCELQYGTDQNGLSGCCTAVCNGDQLCVDNCLSMVFCNGCLPPECNNVSSSFCSVQGDCPSSIAACKGCSCEKVIGAKRWGGKWFPQKLTLSL